MQEKSGLAGYFKRHRKQFFGKFLLKHLINNIPFILIKTFLKVCYL